MYALCTLLDAHCQCLKASHKYTAGAPKRLVHGSINLGRIARVFGFIEFPQRRHSESRAHNLGRFDRSFRPFQAKVTNQGDIPLLSLFTLFGSRQHLSNRLYYFPFLHPLYLASGGSGAGGVGTCIEDASHS